jgi:ketosteroid isomerase-like protein
MESGPDDRLALIRRYYQAYENDDRPAIEQVLHPDFTFTSPNPDDDRIGWAAYFERCWPPHEDIKSFALLDICADNEGALVRYRATQFAGPGFDSVEHFEFRDGEFRDGLIAHVEAYFGRDPGE